MLCVMARYGKSTDRGIIRLPSYHWQPRELVLIAIAALMLLAIAGMTVAQDLPLANHAIKGLFGG